MRIYVASSWRNKLQSRVVEVLRAAGHEVYDFRNPGPLDDGFQWSWIDPEWQSWTPSEFILSLGHEYAERGFNVDFRAMVNAEAFVLVMPCGRSAHLEAGWAIGSGKPTAILLDDGSEPELMYKLSDRLCTSTEEVIGWLVDLPTLPKRHPGAAIQDALERYADHAYGKGGTGLEAELVGPARTEMVRVLTLLATERRITADLYEELKLLHQRIAKGITEREPEQRLRRASRERIERIDALPHLNGRCTCGGGGAGGTCIWCRTATALESNPWAMDRLDGFIHGLVAGITPEDEKKPTCSTCKDSRDWYDCIGTCDRTGKAVGADDTCPVWRHEGEGDDEEEGALRETPAARSADKPRGGGRRDGEAQDGEGAGSGRLPGEADNDCNTKAKVAEQGKSNAWAPGIGTMAMFPMPDGEGWITGQIIHVSPDGYTTTLRVESMDTDRAVPSATLLPVIDTTRINRACANCANHNTPSCRRGGPALDPVMRYCEGWRSR